MRLYDRSVMRVTLNVLRSPEDARDAVAQATRTESVALIAFLAGLATGIRPNSVWVKIQERADTFLKDNN